MKKAFFILIVLVLLLAINNLLHSIYDLWHKKDLLTNTQKQLVAEELKNQKLKSELSYVNTVQFIEQQAHDKLFMVMPGEQKVLISQKLLHSNSDNSAKKNLPNWQKWLNLFW